MAKNHEAYLKEHLEKTKKIYLGSELITLLKNKYPDLTEAGCRKIISRMSNNGLIKSSTSITFGKNQHVYSSKEIEFNYNTLKEIIKSNKRALYRTIVKLYKENVLTENEILKVSGVTIQATKNKICLDQIISDLKKLDLIQEIEFEKIRFFCIANKSSEELIKSKYKRVLKEELITTMSLNWLNSINLITTPYSFYKGRANNYIGVKQSNLIFDAQAFSRSVGFNLVENKNDTIVVIDVNIANQYEEFDFEGFYDRVQILINSTKGRKRRVLPIIIAKGYSPKALNLIKTKNYLHYSFASIYGNNFEQIIERFITIRNEESSLNDFEQLMQQIGTNVNYSNIKGEFFEYVMKSAFSKIYNHSNEEVKRGVLESQNDTKYECDIVITTKDEYIFIELKAYNRDNIIMLGKCETDGTITPNTVKWFLNRTYMYFKQKYSTNPENRKCKCCYITTSAFHEDSLKVLKEKNNSKDKPDNLECYYDYKSLCELLKKNKCEEELKTVEKYFS